MSTVASTTARAKAPQEMDLGKTLASTTSKCCEFAPQKKPKREIVREELKNQKELDKLEEKYNTKFKYLINKAALNLPSIDGMAKCKSSNDNPTTHFSTTA